MYICILSGQQALYTLSFWIVFTTELGEMCLNLILSDNFGPFINNSPHNCFSFDCEDEKNIQ